MAAPAGTYKDRQFLAVIGDEDSVTGLLLAGIGVSKGKKSSPSNAPLSKGNKKEKRNPASPPALCRSFHRIKS
ncbi:vacuolar ATP synthase subunit F [Histoplasma capsulatum G186AR]|uniref:Vacuolar ATP synthase subunit F n=1 Tax=Ajellomyces capsulatus TaxID=5037 RepID=A0A8H7Z9V6_AJECA|nr:vacuolar ATP synthase subunit F [Histoplasma capsulatum]QSS70065.1 vacuolar ATP synthase subunit F [Histoplasma capsulatum G186AR]